MGYNYYSLKNYNHEKNSIIPTYWKQLLRTGI